MACLLPLRNYRYIFIIEEYDYTGRKCGFNFRLSGTAIPERYHYRCRAGVPRPLTTLHIFPSNSMFDARLFNSIPAKVNASPDGVAEVEI